MSSTRGTLPAFITNSPRPWAPHTYQRRAVDFLRSASAGALFLDPGLGKTSIVLEAFRQLKETGAARRMLVIAPLRVCQTVWRQEGRKWAQFGDLTFTLLHGDKKRAEAAAETDIALINPEGIAWLAQQGCFPWDTVVIDELTKFKNARAGRHKSLRPMLRRVRRRWGLTGTPAPNGYMDLFGQFLILDDGAALGKYITHYRLKYFVPDYNGFDWKLQPNGQAKIEERIRPYVLRMNAEDYLELPELVDDIRRVELPADAMKVYRQMRYDMLANLPGGVVTAENAGGVALKLKQMANGAVYDAAHNYETIHSAKLDAVEELVEELAGQPLLLAYEFNHDLERLRERFPNAPYLGAGVTPKQTQEVVDAWNRGDVPLLLAHPKSAGHGLNLQENSASHVGWFGPTYDLELYDQFIQRVRRQGNTSQRVVNHIFVAQHSIDEIVLRIVADKHTTQAGLLQRLAAALTEEEGEMERLGTQNGQPIMPKGWGAPAVANGAAAAQPQPTPQQQATAQMMRETHAAQRQKIREKIDGSQGGAVAEQPKQDRSAARSLFSPGIQAQLNGDKLPEGHATVPPSEPPPPIHTMPGDVQVQEIPAMYSPSTAPAIDYAVLAREMLHQLGKALLSV